jgi:hypothetical protein
MSLLELDFFFGQNLTKSLFLFLFSVDVASHSLPCGSRRFSSPESVAILDQVVDRTDQIAFKILVEQFFGACQCHSPGVLNDLSTLLLETVLAVAQNRGENSNLLIYQKRPISS